MLNARKTHAAVPSDRGNELACQPVLRKNVADRIFAWFGPSVMFVHPLEEVRAQAFSQ